MTLSKTWNGSNYSIPQSGEKGWAALTNFLADLADNAQTINKQKIARRTATTSPVAVSASTDCYVGVNVSGSAASVTLPAGVNGQYFIIADESGAAATYNITITPNGVETIDGGATYTINTNKQVVGVVFSGSDWKIFSNFTTTSFSPSSSDTLTNKKLSDSTVTFVDNGDDTKQLAFECSGITTATTRTITAADRNVSLLNVPASLGTANQVLGVNSGATDTEYKTVTSGTSGTDFAVAHSANTITLNLPDAGAAARGAVTTGTQTFAGAKTFSGAASFSSTASFTGATTHNAGAVIIGNVSANDSAVVFTTSDNRIQISTPTAARTHTLPTTSIVAGDVWEFANLATSSANYIILNASGGSQLCVLPATGRVKIVANTNTPTTPAHWTILNLVSDWVSFTPTVSAGFGSVTNNAAVYRAVGKNIKVRGSFTAGTLAASVGTVSLPTAYAFSTNGLSLTANTAGNPGNIVGMYGASATSNESGHIVTNPGTSTSVVYFSVRYAAAGGNISQSSMSSQGTNGEVFSYEYEVSVP